MPSGVYFRSDQWRKIHSEARKGEKSSWYGRHHSEETKKKMSEAQSQRSIETRRKMSEAQKGKHCSEEARRNMSKAQKGKQHTEEAKQKISKRFKGIPLSEEHRKKIAEAQKGEKGYNWQGGKSFEPYDPNFNYDTKRKVLERDKYACQNCGICKGLFTKKEDLVIHHIDGDKKNSKLKNLVTLCRSCHSKHHNPATTTGR